MKQKQKTAIARQRAHGNSLRTWLQDRAAAAAKRRTPIAEESYRGVDRVPARYQVTRPAPEVLVQLEPQPRRRSRKVRLREQRSARLAYAVGEALKGREFVTDEGEQAAAAAVRRWVR